MKKFLLSVLDDLFGVAVWYTGLSAFTIGLTCWMLVFGFTLHGYFWKLLFWNEASVLFVVATMYAFLNLMAMVGFIYARKSLTKARLKS